MPDLPELLVADAGAWHAWLERNHASSSGVWLVLARKGADPPTTLTHAQALEEAICYGWIDGRVHRRDAATYQQRFTPRRPRSRWSRRNVGLAQHLIEQSRMQPAGLAEVGRARADGRWDAAYEGSATIGVPNDLATALAADPAAAETFSRLNARNRYAILYRLTTSTRPETRARRISSFVNMLARGETIYPQS